MTAALTKVKRTRGQRPRMRAREITESIEVHVPVSAAYNQWTQFEEFPRFMKDVVDVRQIDDRTLRWRARIDGHEVAWTAEIHFQEPDHVILWKTLEGAKNIGRMDFEPIRPDAARIRVAIQYRPHGVVEQLGSVFGIPRRHVRADLERFKRFIESRRQSTGAWRGHIPPAAPEAIGPGFDKAPLMARGAVRPGYGEP